LADNKVMNAGSGGATIATDDIGGVDHPRVKVEFGADGSATDVSSANPLPTVQTGALPAGANAIGKLAANSGVDIGDVDVTSSALPTGASTAAKQPALGTAGAASADVISVQGVASGTVIPVSDGAGSLTVDNAGTFAVQADTELTTADLDAGAGTDTRAVVGLVVAKSGGAANVSSVDPLPVSIASSVSVTSSSDRAEDSVAVSGHSGTPVLDVRNDSAAAKTSTDGDYSMLATDDAGRVGVRTSAARSRSMTTAGR
jgi:hypothetical protein